MNPLKIGIFGAPGQQKTDLALSLATRLANATHGAEAKVLGLNLTGDLPNMAPDYPSLTVLNAPDCSPEAIVNGLNYASANGYAALVIDNFSFEWKGGPSSVMELVDKEVSGKNDNSSAWRTVRPRHAAMLAAIRSARIHVLGVYWSDTRIIVSRDIKGRAEPLRVLTGIVGPDDVELYWSNFIELRADGNSLNFLRSEIRQFWSKVIPTPWDEIFPHFEARARFEPTAVPFLPGADQNKAASSASEAARKSLSSGRNSDGAERPTAATTSSTPAGAEAAPQGGALASSPQPSGDQSAAQNRPSPGASIPAEASTRPADAPSPAANAPGGPDPQNPSADNRLNAAAANPVQPSGTITPLSPAKTKAELITEIALAIGPDGDERLNIHLRTASPTMKRAWLTKGAGWRSLSETRLVFLSANLEGVKRVIGLQLKAA